jgi:polyisoprenoid-binding protein YceI
VAAVVLIPAVGVAAERLEIDSGHTYPHFAVSHLGFSVQQGRFNDTTGHVVFDRDGGESVVHVTIATASIDTGLDRRDEHLRGEDFFNVSDYPQMTYHSENVVFHGEDSATVFGELTLLGVTQPVTLAVNDINCGENPMNGAYTCGFTATGVLKRSDFGMGYGIPAIGDEVTLRIQAEAVAAEQS